MCRRWREDQTKVVVSKRCFFQCLDLLEERHGRVVKDTFETGIVKKWSEDEFSHGAFVLFGVTQRDTLLVEKHGILFSTPKFSKFVHSNIWLSLLAKFLLLGSTLIRSGKSHVPKNETLIQFHNGWVESAVESAIRVLVNLWPQQYDQTFGEGMI